MRRLLHDLPFLAGHLPAAGQSAEPVGSYIFPREDGEHARHGLGVGRVDGADAGVGERRAQDHRVALLRQGDVVRVPPVSAQEAIVFLALDRNSDGSFRHGRSPFLACR